MGKKNFGKLTLTRETIRDLTGDQLRYAVGGKEKLPSGNSCGGGGGGGGATGGCGTNTCIRTCKDTCPVTCSTCV